jgi:hypothetical protein
MGAIADRSTATWHWAWTSFLLVLVLIAGVTMDLGGRNGRVSIRQAPASVAARSSVLPKVAEQSPAHAAKLAEAAPKLATSEAASEPHSPVLRSGRHSHKARVSRALAAAEKDLFAVPTAVASPRIDKSSANLKELAAEVSRTATIASVALPQELDSDQPVQHLALQEPATRQVELAHAMSFEGQLQPLSDKELASVRGGGGSAPGVIGADAPAI